MRDKFNASISSTLSCVPDGSFEILCHGDSKDVQPVARLITETNGKGRIDIYPLFPGIQLMRHRYLADDVNFHHDSAAHILELDHCRSGRVGWDMCEGTSVYLGPGDICIHSMASCSDSHMSLPLGYYEGIAISANLRVLERSCPDILTEGGFNPEVLYNRYCIPERPVGIPASPRLDSMFSYLYELAGLERIPCYKLKAMESLLYLQHLKPDVGGLTQYGSSQTARIKEIHDFAAEHLDCRFTIEELAKKFLINTSSLKAVFKAVYGMPIASYFKEMRIKKAMSLLLDTDMSISQIAEMVGYSSQGKFTQAFKEVSTMLPTEYRKRYASS